jgi:hypothetical protein
MNTLVYADVPQAETSQASTIASTMQQMSLSFGVAAASLTTALFIPSGADSDAGQMIHGTHAAFVLLGIMTVISATVFRGLKQADGANVSQHAVAEGGLHTGEYKVPA